MHLAQTFTETGGKSINSLTSGVLENATISELASQKARPTDQWARKSTVEYYAAKTYSSQPLKQVRNRRL